eukprot:TRINITY_DN353_c0_g1_i1.p1 TRINITY_DN353_c0_g1~~TRINITY_DN353_c0_g1_i1.p1  ORF type:complete len:192 (+),score=27.84 TRINITY_DN353_c0_g1_i1:18-593(+)
MAAVASWQCRVLAPSVIPSHKVIAIPSHEGIIGKHFASFSGLRVLEAAQSGENVSQSLAERMSGLVIEAREPTRREKLKTRHMRIRRKLNGTTERPRLAVFRSNKHIYAQVIDDTQQHTLAAASTLTPSLRTELNLTAGPTIEASKQVGFALGKLCVEKGITKVAFDRGGFVYHGKIKALADGAREGGLDF